MKTSNNQHTNSLKSTEHIEKIIGVIMRIGVSIAAIVLIAGIILALFKNNEVLDMESITIPYLLKLSIHGNAYAIMMIGIFLLILTPIIRVIASIVLFAYEKDKLYTAITTLVLIILLMSFFIGHNW